MKNTKMKLTFFKPCLLSGIPRTTISKDCMMMFNSDRDAKIGTIYEGTSNMQLQTIAKFILKD